MEFAALSEPRIRNADKSRADAVQGFRTARQQAKRAKSFGWFVSSYPLLEAFYMHKERARNPKVYQSRITEKSGSCSKWKA